MKSLIFFLICSIVLTACASVSTQKEKVLVTSSPEEIEGCKYMGQVDSSSILRSVKAPVVTYDHTRHELINKARQLGANVVLTSTNSATMGEAYECKRATF